tara:strand:- start:343 stop:852 length:510 start_codon:yes stop_codon:yes gene_type:complete
MSGYEPNVTVSSLGGGRPGQFESGYGNTLVGGEVALNRRKLRKAFKSNNVSEANVKSSCGPFRSAYNLGDPLSRKNMSCGGPNQVNDTNSSVLNHKMADSVSNTDCGNITHGVTPLQVSLKSGNVKYVSDGSLYTQFKHLEAVNLTYNDKSGGGDEHNGSYSFLKALRG